MSEKNSDCKCTYPCSRHGDCRACIAYHQRSGSKTNCGKTSKDLESKPSQK